MSNVKIDLNSQHTGSYTILALMSDRLATGATLYPKWMTLRYWVQGHPRLEAKVDLNSQHMSSYLLLIIINLLLLCHVSVRACEVTTYHCTGLLRRTRCFAPRQTTLLVIAATQLIKFKCVTVLSLLLLLYIVCLCGLVATLREFFYSFTL